MSRNEDYLDNLLTSVTDRLSEFDDDFEQNRESLRQSYQTQNDLPPKTQSALDEIREDNFLREFEDELRADGTDDDLMREFERELNGETDSFDTGPQPDDLTARLDSPGLDMDKPPQGDTMTQDDLDALFSGGMQDDSAGQASSQMQDDFLNDITSQMQESFPDETPESLMGSLPDSGLDDPTAGLADDGLDSLTAQMSGGGLDDLTAGLADNGLDDLTAGLADDGLDSLTAQMSGGGLDDLTAGLADDGMDDLLGQMQDIAQDNVPGSMQDDLRSQMQENIPDAFPQTGNGQEGSMEAPEGMEGLEDIFGDVLDGEGMGMPDMQGDGMTMQQDTDILDDGLDQILSESDDEALSEITRMLDGDGGGDSAPGMPEDDQSKIGGPDFSFAQSELNQDDGADKKKKEKNPNGLFAKLSRLLFGTPEELDPQAAAEYAAANPESTADPKELKEQKKKEKELKKQQKKEAAEEKKKEKEAAKAEKAAQQESKPKKEKKPKKPKSKQPKEPPLPKVPVMTMWILALSIMALVFLGTSFVGYSSTVSQAKDAFKGGDYVTAYTKLKGMKVKSADEDLYRASQSLAGIQTELDAFTALMENRQYEMALDALVRGYGRCAIHSSEAEEWGVSEELQELENQLDKLLKEQFDVSKRRAKKLYKIKKRTEYTLALQEILEGLGLN